MNRTLFGALLLTGLLVGGILAGHFMTRDNEEVAALLETASAQALEGHPDIALDTARNAYTLWQRQWNTNAAFTDHGPLEQVDAGFAQLWVYSETEDTASFAAVCAMLACKIRAVGAAGSADWQNIL